MNSENAPSLLHHERQHERKPTYRTVQWDHRSGEGKGGALCDLTPAGTFLTPFGRDASSIRVGDTVWIVIELDGERHSLSAEVRWHGWSAAHSCVGFGLQFDPHSEELAERLFLQVDKTGHFFVPT